VRRLRLVAAHGEELERLAAEQAHPVLRVAHGVVADEREQASRGAVRQAPLGRHRGEVGEAVADNQVG
jgi:hypothetical protein